MLVFDEFIRSFKLWELVFLLSSVKGTGFFFQNDNKAEPVAQMVLGNFVSSAIGLRNSGS